MVTKISPADKKPSARERLLAAASELFYEEGINTVGIDRVIERAGVAKASLYDCFGSKEELIRQYLVVRHETRRARILDKLAAYKTPRTKLLGVFDVMGALLEEQNFRGCAFLRASAEARPDSKVKSACDDSRAWLRGLFVALAREAGVVKADALAQQLVLLYDGVSVSAQMDRDASAAAAARKVATALLDAALA
ncbi:MAG TPA: TetR/AcrR family transcriptional regulator [Usitatibacteraceae bacterium]|jgi:AcrR family transcriptional regulator